MPSDIVFLVVVTIAIAVLFAPGLVHVTRKCPLSRYGECQVTKIESDGRRWRPSCSGRSMRCGRRRRALRDFPDDVNPDGEGI